MFNAADTAWITVATALVLFMTLPGLAMFYGGLVRSRNVLSIFMHCFSLACLMSLLWFTVGYSMAFGEAPLQIGNLGSIIGGFDKVLLLNINAESISGTIPELLFFIFQMTFAIITAAVIAGAYVERVQFGFVLLFSSLWMLLCYAPVAHWIWGGGFLSDGGIFGETGARDFAGGIVVHETAGIAALVIAVILGRRKFLTAIPHNPGYTIIGAGMLWVGWYGFNGGSQLAADYGAVKAIVVTHLAAAAGSLSWAAWEKIRIKKASPIGLVTGTIAGLAAVTPASGFITPLQAIVIGALSGLICNYAVRLIRGKMQVDDSLDVFAVHGAGGIFGTVMIAVFGLGTWQAQLGSVLIVGVYTLVVTIGIVKLVALITPIRVDEDAEIRGLDISSHGERAYGPDQ